MIVTKAEVKQTVGHSYATDLESRLAESYEQAIELLRLVNADIVADDGSGDTVYIVQDYIAKFLDAYDANPLTPKGTP